MTFPTLSPNSRQFDPGNWPIRTYNAQNGTEVRLLYGSQRYNLQINLSYTNIPDTDAESFLTHYFEQNGTFRSFSFTAPEAAAVFNGWAGVPAALAAPAGVEWRYDAPPRIESIVPGISTVNVVLRGVI